MIMAFPKNFLWGGVQPLPRNVKAHGTEMEKGSPFWTIARWETESIRGW